MKTLRQALSMLPVVFTCTAWKVSKYEVIFSPYFPAFGLNTERYSIFSPNAGIYGPEITPYLDTFHAQQRNISWSFEINNDKKVTVSCMLNNDEWNTIK